MKIIKHLFLFLAIFTSTLLFSQDPKKMNKSELKEELIILNSKIDSLNQLTQKLTTVKQELQAKISELEQKSNNNDLEINRLYRFVDEKEKQISQLKEEVQKLSKTISENEVESKKKISEKESEIGKLKEDIKTLSKSISENETLKKQIEQELRDSKNQKEQNLAQLQTTQENDKNNYYKSFKGFIGEKTKVTLNISKIDSFFYGEIFKDNNINSLTISGQLLPNNKIELTVWNEKDEDIASIQGKFSTPESFEGTWMIKKTKQSNTIKLNQENNQYAISYHHYRYENCNLKREDENMNNETGETTENNPSQNSENSDPSSEKPCSYKDIDLIKISTPNELVNQKINLSLQQEISGKEYSSIEVYLNDLIANSNSTEKLKKNSEDEEPENEFFSHEDIHYLVETLTDDILSIRGFFGLYDEGAAHPMNSYKFFNYSLESGSMITLDQILIPNYSKKLNRVGEKKFIEQNGNLGWNFDPGKFSLNENFSIKKGGLIFQFIPYEIGTYAMGAPEVYIPFSEIMDLIKPNSLLFKMIQK